MTGTQTAIAIGMCIIACTALCILLYKLGYSDGWDARGDHEHDRQARRQLRETRAAAGIRAKTGPCDPGGYPQWYATVSRGRTVLAMPGIPMTALTQTVPVSHRRATDTGELRALAAATDHYIERMRADGDAWRQKSATWNVITETEFV